LLIEIGLNQLFKSFDLNPDNPGASTMICVLVNAQVLALSPSVCDEEALTN